MSEAIRVIVADDHPLFRQGVIQSLSEAAHITVTGEAETVARTIEISRELLPDVLLLDMQFPDGSGLDVLDAVRVGTPSCHVIVLTVVEDQDTLVEALKRGAKGYVLKGIAAHDLVAAVEAVASGETYVTPEMAGRLLKEMTRKPEPGVPHLSELTERERSILDLVAGGKTNREIADELFLSEKTIKHYMTNILEKLHVRNRVEAALFLTRYEK